MTKILVIEDNNEINHMLCELLEKNDYATKSAFSGTEGLLYLSLEAYSLVLLDLMLPGMNGEEILSKIRQNSKIPVIIISAKTEISGKVNLLENGADDYITKPFDVREVMARIRLQLNKNQASSTGNPSTDKNRICCGELEIDNTMHSVRINGNELNLTRQEYNILYLLFENPKKAFTKQELFEAAWEEYYCGADKTLNVHISNIRNKIKQFTETSYIETVWGIGFRAGGKRD